MARYILTFTTPGGNYVYDREVNSLLSVNDEEFASFRRIEEGVETDEDWGLLERYVEQGYLRETKLKEIEHPATPYMEFYLNDHVEQITMQVTQDCNLRCRYCTYSGNYDHHRVHSRKVMPLDTMKGSIDFFMTRSRKVQNDLVIGFYGGEPFLEIDNIKKCVEYVKTNYSGRAVRYTVTTNGTLFNDEVIEFLEKEENFNINISFDGPKNLHDQNRIFSDGRGSFDEIMTQVEYIKKNHSNLFERISFLTTIAPGTDLSCVADFFDATDILDDRMARYNTVSNHDAREAIIYDDLYLTTYNYEFLKGLLSALGEYSKNKLSKLFTTNLSEVEKLYASMVSGLIGEKFHPSGPCLPGVMRPFIAADGNILPCERVGEESNAMIIGHVNSGFDISKVMSALNVGKLTEFECRTCWNFLYCGLCVVACDGGTELSREVRLTKCNSAKLDTIDNLKTICLLLENGYDFERRTITKKDGSV